jgi:type IV pilus assembly protein PilW
MKLTQQKGFTIVELMVAAILGLLILGGAISMFVSNKRIYTEQDEMGRLQENARFAIDMMMRDIRMAGYAGCADEIETVVNHINGATNDDSLYFFTPVEGSENAANWQPSNSNEEVASMLAGSDSITVRYLGPTGIFVMNPAMTAASAAIHISTGSDLVTDDIVAITDCNSADIVSLTSDARNTGCGAGASSTGPDDNCKSTFNHNTGTGTPGNSFKELSKTYTSDAQIVRYVTRRYFVGNDANGNPVLHRKSGIAPAEEVIDGVENLQILYGEDTSSDQIPDVYRTAAAVINWDDVISVRISLLMRTVREYGGDTDRKTYDLLGTTINPTDDRRRRRVFTTTIQIRNRST